MFWGTQDADEDYYGLGLQERSGRQSPFVDRTVYTDIAAAASSAFLELYQVLGEPEHLTVALRNLEFLWQHLYELSRGMAHFPSADPLPPLLVDQLAMAAAWLDAYQSTGTSHYLDRARELAGIMQERFAAPGGGFLDSAGGEDIGRLRYQQKPLVENSAAAQVFTRLAHLTGVSGYRETAESTLAAQAGMYQQHGTMAAEYALAVDRLLQAPAHVAIVGNPGEGSTQALLSVALRAFRPGKIVQVLDPEGSRARLKELDYPPKPVAAYICHDQTCLAPVTRPEDLALAIAST